MNKTTMLSPRAIISVLKVMAKNYRILKECGGCTGLFFFRMGIFALFSTSANISHIITTYVII